MDFAFRMVNLIHLTSKTSKTDSFVNCMLRATPTVPYLLSRTYTKVLMKNIIDNLLTVKHSNVERERERGRKLTPNFYQIIPAKKQTICVSAMDAC